MWEEIRRTEQRQEIDRSAWAAPAKVRLETQVYGSGEAVTPVYFGRGFANKPMFRFSYTQDGNDVTIPVLDARRINEKNDAVHGDGFGAGHIPTSMNLIRDSSFKVFDMVDTYVGGGGKVPEVVDLIFCSNVAGTVYNYMANAEFGFVYNVGWDDFRGPNFQPLYAKYISKRYHQMRPPGNPDTFGLASSGVGAAGNYWDIHFQPMLYWYNFTYQHSRKRLKRMYRMDPTKTDSSGSYVERPTGSGINQTFNFPGTTYSTNYTKVPSTNPFNFSDELTYSRAPSAAGTWGGDETMAPHFTKDSPWGDGYSYVLSAGSASDGYLYTTYGPNMHFYPGDVVVLKWWFKSVSSDGVSAAPGNGVSCNWWLQHTSHDSRATELRFDYVPGTDWGYFSTEWKVLTDKTIWAEEYEFTAYMGQDANIIFNEQNSYTYGYFNASGGITYRERESGDPLTLEQTEWGNPANAWDGDFTNTYATATPYGANNPEYVMSAIGASITPVPDQSIVSVGARVWRYNPDGSDTEPNPTSWFTLTAPGGGWNWTTVQNLTCELTHWSYLGGSQSIQLGVRDGLTDLIPYGPSNVESWTFGGDYRIYGVEIRVETTPDNDVILFGGIEVEVIDNVLGYEEIFSGSEWFFKNDGKRRMETTLEADGRSVFLSMFDPEESSYQEWSTSGDVYYWSTWYETHPWLASERGAWEPGTFKDWHWYFKGFPILSTNEGVDKDISTLYPYLKGSADWNNVDPAWYLYSPNEADFVRLELETSSTSNVELEFEWIFSHSAHSQRTDVKWSYGEDWALPLKKTIKVGAGSANTVIDLEIPDYVYPNLGRQRSIVPYADDEELSYDDYIYNSLYPDEIPGGWVLDTPMADGNNVVSIAFRFRVVGDEGTTFSYSNPRLYKAMYSQLPEVLTAGIESWIQDDAGMYIGANVWLRGGSIPQ